jgi:hypothetical protein
VQVLRAKVAVNTPNLSTVGGFDYVEGEGLDEDDVERCQALLLRALAQLPGGGVVNGTILEVQDQSQALDFEVIISHQVGQGIVRLVIVWLAGLARGDAMRELLLTTHGHGVATWHRSVRS